MITLFRRIREKLIASGSLTKYLLYAAGEILLVMIGILLALQVNNWNEEQVRRDKEQSYLLEIRENLVTDSLQIDRVLTFNQAKTDTIRKVISMLVSDMDEVEITRRIEPYMTILPNFEFLFPTSVAFDNMVSSESISLIRDQDLRTLLSSHYSNESLFLGTQERTKQLARNFSDHIQAYIFTKELVDTFFGSDSEYPSAAGYGLKSDPIIIGDLFIMVENMKAQNALLNFENEDIIALIASIDAYLQNF